MKSLQYLKTVIAGLFVLINIGFIHAQNTQNIKGIVIDADSDLPLIGATVALVGSPEKGAATDIDGYFTIPNIALGRHTIEVAYLGYNTQTIPNVLVTAGKEVMLEIKLEENVSTLNEVVVTATVDKNKPINELASVSARTFSIDEVTRYSGGSNDVAMLVRSFAGVSGANDSRNDIIIRGNSPAGVLWRMEGVPIPNPNHFSTLGTTGGPVSAMNPNMLKTSDFLTSAFPSEYGNALAGVFDLSLRSGNKDNMEITAQLAAFSGFEGLIEGPLNKEGTGSYIVSYRHSFVELADKLNVNIGTDAVPNYKDIMFKIDLPNSSIGKFSLFGLGGLSDIDFLAEEIGENDYYGADDLNSYATSKLGTVGLQHRLIVNDKSYVKTTLSLSHSGNTYQEDSIYAQSTEEFTYFDVDDYENRFILNSFYNKKVNAKWNFRTGIQLDFRQISTSVLSNLELDIDADQDGHNDLFPVREFDDGVQQWQAYFQSKYKFDDKFSINGGVHLSYFDLTETVTAEPRLAFSYDLNDKNSLTLGYGMHTQIQPLPIYFISKINGDGSTTQTNLDLEPSKSHHYVLSYDTRFAPDWRGKAELYAQRLTDVPVNNFESSFSLLNAGTDFVFPDEHDLVNEGEGLNYGLEVTIEKFFSKNYYALFTTSLFNSETKGSDGVWRNSAFNQNYIFNILFGKEWKLNEQHAITFDTKFNFAGGRYYTPFDEEASSIAGGGVRDYDRTFEARYPDYLRWDVKLGYRFDSKKKKFSQLFALDFQNVTNRRNVFSERYSVDRNETYYTYQRGFFPDILFRLQF